MLRYKPWVGKFYNNRNNPLGTKLLILGESHWGMDEIEDGEWDVQNITKLIIKRQISGEKRIRFLTSIFRICKKQFGNLSEEDFWNSVVLYNYIQVKGNINKPGDRPTSEQWEASIKPFINVIRKFTPNKMLVLGKQLWFKLPNANGCDGPFEFTWYYEFTSGKKCLATYIYHPSRYPRGFKGRNSGDIFKKLLRSS